MSEQSFEQMLEESFKTIRNGEVVEGTVIDVKPDEIVLNIGYKSDGIITRSEYTNEPNVDLTTLIETGSTMEAKVLKVNDGDGGFNVIYIDKTARTAKIVDANCKGKDCAYFAPIDDNNKIIYCSPHGLRVEPLFRDLDSPNIIM